MSRPNSIGSSIRLKSDLSLSSHAACLRLTAVVFVLLAGIGGSRAEDNTANTRPEIRIRLVPVRSAVLSAQLAGQISELPLREGDSFTTGQKLVAFDCGVERARQAHAAAQESATRRIYEVKSKLNNLNSIGSLELATAGADHAVAEADLQLAREVTSHCIISAPFAGRVGPVDVKRFQYVAEGQKLLEIIDPTQLEAEMLIPSSWSRWLKPGYAVDMGI